jgi:lipoate---protein ligase
LIEAEETGGAGLLWFWSPPDFAVVLGASRRIRDEVVLESCRADRVPILRRCSGGGTVVVGPGSLNVSVILPQTAAPGLWAVDAAHQYVLDRIAGSLRLAGAPVELCGTGDLTIAGRKCGGSAQRRLKHFFLVHCTLLLEFSIDRIARYLQIPARQPVYRAGRSHADFLCNLSLPRTAVVAALRGEFGCGAADSPSLPDRGLPLARAGRLAEAKYGTAAWTERL